MPRKTKRNEPETDSAYLLKLVMYFIFGSFWIHLSSDRLLLPIPIGFIIGVLFASHEHFRIDRKLEYVVLVVAMFVSFLVSPRFIIGL